MLGLLVWIIGAADPIAPASYNWPVLLGVAAPFILALGVGVRYLMKKLDKAEERNLSLTDKILNDFAPAIRKSAETQEKTLDFVQELRGQLEYERDLRIRAEERLNESHSVNSTSRRRIWR